MYYLLASKTPEISPAAANKSITGILMIVIGFFLFWLTITALRKNASKGDISGSANITGATLLALIPAGIAVGGVVLALGYGSAIATFVVSIFT